MQEPGPAAGRNSGDALFDAFVSLSEARWPQSRAVYSEQLDYLVDWYQLENLRADPEALARRLSVLSREAMPLSRKNPELWQLVQQAMEPELLSVAELRSLEPRFGADCRYWQLLHWAAMQQRRNAGSAAAWEFCAEAYEVLLEGRERGALDGLALLLLIPLLEAADPQWPQRQYELQAEVLARLAQEAQAARRGGQRMPAPPERRELAYFQQQGERAQALGQRLGLSIDGLFQEALARDPQWAQIHYQYALYLHQQGRHAKAYIHLSSGNQAGMNRLLKPYPQSWVREQALQGEAAGSLKLFWDIEMHSLAEHEPQLFMGLRGLPSAVAAELPPQQRLDPSTQLLHMLARSGTAQLASGFESQIAAIALSKLLESALRFLGERSPSAESLAGARDLSERLRTAAINALQQSAQPGVTALSDEEMREMESFKLDWDSQRAAMLPLYRRHFEQLATGSAFAREALWPLLKEVQRIDLTELALRSQGASEG
ncbi:hypothetical protein IT575_01465 [bacterium]|nr:hypothetical protein [bacterium]